MKMGQMLQMPKFKSPRRLLPLFCAALLALTACASKPKFQPEVGAPGAVAKGDDVVVSIPPEHPVLKMKLVSAGINSDNMLTVRMFFKRNGDSDKEILDPRQQALYLPGSTNPIYPAKVHADSKAKPVVKLSDQEKQSVELLYPLPGNEHLFPYFNLKWKIQYQVAGHDKSMSETVRFGAIEKSQILRGPGQSPADPDFPFQDYGTFPDGWMGPDMMWW